MLIQQLKNYINTNGLKKQKVAQLLGISNVHLSYILNDKRPLSIDLESKIRTLIS